MRIYFLRHGEDEPGYRGGWSGRGLTSAGRAQVEHVARQLAELARPIGRLISSDLTRAAETAAIVARCTRLEPEFGPQWREMNNGGLAGLPNAEADHRFPGVYFSRLGMDELFAGGEAAAAVLEVGFEHLKASQIEACYATWNQASERVLQSIGMSFIEHVPRGFQKRGQWVTENRMAVSRAEWSARAAGA